MGLLDDLQQEVEIIREEEFKSSAELEAREEFYTLNLKPVMLRVYDFLSELVENLNIIDRDITPFYPFDPSLPQGLALKQSDYEFDFDNRKTPRQIDVRCLCSLDAIHEFHLPTKDAVLKHTELLEDYAFQFHRKDFRDKQHCVRSANFSLEGPLRIQVRILAHAEDRCIYVYLRNLEDIPLKRYKFSPEQFSDDLLERMGRLLIREESTLVKVEVSDDLRQELRGKIESDKRRNEAELAEAFADLEAEKLSQENSKIVNRGKQAVARSTDKLFGIFRKAK